MDLGVNMGRIGLLVLLLALSGCVPGGGGNNGASDDDSVAQGFTLTADLDDLGEVATGETATTMIRIANDGPGAVTGLLSGSGNSDWSLSGPDDISLSSSWQTTRWLTFTPTTVGPSSTTIAAFLDGSNPSPQTVTIVAEAILDYSGTWSVDPAVSYTCDDGEIDVEVSSLNVADHHPDLTISAGGEAGQPGTMRGGFDSDSSFSVAGLSPAGLCARTYRLTGGFLDLNSLSATLTVEFSGFGCGDCSDQTLSVSATRQLGGE